MYFWSVIVAKSILIFIWCLLHHILHLTCYLTIKLTYNSRRPRATHHGSTTPWLWFWRGEQVRRFEVPLFGLLRPAPVRRFRHHRLLRHGPRATAKYGRGSGCRFWLWGDLEWGQWICLNRWGLVEYLHIFLVNFLISWTHFMWDWTSKPGVNGLFSSRKLRVKS
jgi:hypothetical protein